MPGGIDQQGALAERLNFVRYGLEGSIKIQARTQVRGDLPDQREEYNPGGDDQHPQRRSGSFLTYRKISQEDEQPANSESQPGGAGKCEHQAVTDEDKSCR